MSEKQEPQVEEKERPATEERPKKKDSSKKKGFPLSVFNVAAAILLAIVSIFLLTATIHVDNGYQRLKKISDDYIRWEQTASQMEVSSNTLTFEVRQYAKTRVRAHLEEYFREAKQNRTREKSLEELQSVFPEDSEIIRYLKEALRESRELMEREYTSMRLVVDSKGVEDVYYSDMADYEEVQNVELPPEAENMTKQEKWDLAIELVNDEYYFEAKQRIENNVSLCISELISEVEHRQNLAMLELDTLLIAQGVLIAVFTVLIAITLAVVSFQIMRPMRKAILYIRNDSTVPVSGAREFRIFASVYNRIHSYNKSYREKLAFRADHDPLTGVLNRNGIEKVLKDADLSDVALLIVDIDRFKNFNDQFGHEVGDLVLAKVTQTLQRLFRSNDAIWRLGGDEFAVIMWHIGPEQQEMIAEKIRRANEELGTGVDGLPAVSISVGVAFGAECEPEKLFRHADKALYQTKANGRKGCSFYRPE